MHCGDLYSASSRRYYSEALPTQSRPKKKEYCIKVWNPCLKQDMKKTGESTKKSHENDLVQHGFEYRRQVGMVWTSNTGENEEQKSKSVRLLLERKQYSGTGSFIHSFIRPFL